MDPLNKIARARPCGDHNETCNHDPNSGCLADMVRGFMEDEDHTVGNYGKWRCNCLSGTEEPCPGHKELRVPDVSNGDLGDILEGLVACSYNPIESLLRKEAAKAVENEYRNPRNEEEIQFRKTWLRRSVMKRLGRLGYNTGICKSRWGRTAGFPSGDYEYIDVFIDGKDPFFLDVDFRAQFEIARPTSQYNVLVQILPNIFVGKSGRLQQIIKIMCDCAKRSLEKMGMHLPPWRNHGYLRAKWFGPYIRTTDSIPTPNLATCNKQSLDRDLGSVALKATGWDNGFTHQMELHYDKKMQEAKQKLATSKPSFPEEIEVLTTGWKRPTISLKSVPTGRRGKISGLSCALNGAGLTGFVQVT